MSFRKIFILGIAALILGCNSDTNESNENVDNNGSFSSVYASDIRTILPVTNSSSSAVSVDLTQYVTFSTGTDQISALSIEPLTDKDECSYNYTVTDSKVNFNKSTLGQCVYQYSATSLSSGSQGTALLKAVFTDSVISSEERKFSFTTTLDRNLILNLESDLLDNGYVIDFDSVTLIGDGKIERVTSEIVDDESGTTSTNSSETELLYIPGSSTNTAGVVRVLFAYINSLDNTTVDAVAYITISTLADNIAPKAFDFTYGNLDSFEDGKELDPIYVPLNENIIIDISPYFSKGMLDKNGNSIELVDSNGNNYTDEQGNVIKFFIRNDGTMTDTYSEGVKLIDADKDILQLIDVYSYNANVSAVSDENDNYDSTKFSFSASTRGSHYVTYVLSDHNGGLSVGLVEVIVGEDISKDWDKYLYTDTDIFLSPFTNKEADFSGYRYQGISTETGEYGPIGFYIPKFNYSMALALCKINNMRLPTVDELLELKSKFGGSLYTSNDIYNPDATKRDAVINWPTSVSFWSSTSLGDNQKVVNLNDFSTSESSTELGTNYLTCIADGEIIPETDLSADDALQVIQNDAYRLPFDDTYYDEIRLTIKDYSGIPLVNKSVDVSTDATVDVTYSNNGVTDQNGRLSIYLRGRKVGEHTITLSYMLSQESIKINFQDFPRYGRYNASNGQFCFYSTIELMATGACNDSKSPENFSFSGSEDDMIFTDDYYVYRREGDFWGIGNGTLNVHKDIKSASTQATPILKYSAPTNNLYNYSMFYDGKKYWTIKKYSSTQTSVFSYSNLYDMLNSRSAIDEYLVNVSVIEPTASIFYDPTSEKYYTVKNYSSSLKSGRLYGYSSMEDLLEINGSNRHTADISLNNQNSISAKFVYFYSPE